MIYSLLIVAVAMWGYSCGESSTGNGDGDVEAIVGAWVSEGATHVALGLQQLSKTARIDAEFAENGTYNVVATDSTGSEVTFTGAYELGEETASGIRTITLTQATPSSVTSEGIFQIESDMMTYEVIQTEPTVGAEAPTVEGGFGSTLVGGTNYGTYWVQVFEKQ